MKRVFSLILLLVLALTPVLASAQLTVYYLDVGQADAIYLACDGHGMMIDGGTAADSQLVFSFLRNDVQVDALDCIVATHPHEDHIGGLSAVLSACAVGTLYTPVDAYDSDRMTKLLIKAAEKGTEIVVPAVGDCFSLGGAEVTFLSCGLDDGDVNDLSLVLRVTYGDTVFLFMGDASMAVEDQLLASDTNLTADVLKVAHHGSDTATSGEFLYNVNPVYAVICVEEGNDYLHPGENTMAMLEYYGIYVYRTDLDGTIQCVSDGTSISFLTEAELSADADRYAAPQKPDRTVLLSDLGEGTLYIGNANPNSMKFHLPGCDSVVKMNPENMVSFTSREAAIEAGFSPCGTCHP